MLLNLKIKLNCDNYTRHLEVYHGKYKGKLVFYLVSQFSLKRIDDVQWASLIPKYQYKLQIQRNHKLILNADTFWTQEK